MKFANFLRTATVAASENNAQQQLSEGFLNNCDKIVSPIPLQELVNDLPSASTVVEDLLVEDVTSSNYIFQEGATLFKGST